MRTRSPRPRGHWARLGIAVALWALPLAGLTALEARAGQPATLRDDGAPAASQAPADTSRRARAARKVVTPATKSVAKPAAAAPKSGSSPTKSAAKAPTVAAKTPTVAARPAPTVAKVSAVAANPRAPAQNPATAKDAAGAAPSRTASVTKLPSAASNGRVASTMGPAVAKSAAPPKSTGSTLAQSGRTTVKGPSPTANVTKIGPTAAGKATPAGSAAAASPSPAKPAPAIAAPREDHVTYQYNALGRRDPFRSLMDGDYVASDNGDQVPPDLGGLKVMGIVWGSGDQFAMVEDVRGNSYVLRRGDRVMNGFVEGLKRDAMIVNITVDGQSQSVSIPVTRKGDKSNANR